MVQIQFWTIYFFLQNIKEYNNLSQEHYNFNSNLINEFYKININEELSFLDKYFDKYLNTNIKIVNNLNTLSLDFKSLFNNQNIIFSFSETLNLYSFKLVYFLYLDLFYQNTTFVINKFYFRNMSLTNSDEFGLLLSFFANQFYFLLSFSFPIFNFFFNNFFNSLDFHNVFHNNPEFFFIYKNYLFKYFELYFSSLYPTLKILTLNESFIIASTMIFQFFFIYIIILILIIMYFNYYGNYNTEENIIDQDYLIFNMILESEEEIGSFDDILLTSVILVFIFF